MVEPGGLWSADSINALFLAILLAHITAIYKKSGPKTCKTSFRPISILPTLSKLFESVIHDRLVKHCIENDIITDKQAAYLKGDSTVNQLLYMVHNIEQNWTNKKITQGLAQWPACQVEPNWC